jgi:hypothetical protein
MPDFSWTKQHDLIQSQRAMQAAFEQIGFVFTPVATSLERNFRPRTTGATADQRARLELIGPDDIVFKATLIRQLLPGNPHDAATLIADIGVFLTTLVPGWAEAQAWSESVAHNLVEQSHMQTEFRDLVIEARATKNGQQFVVGVTWQP